MKNDAARLAALAEVIKTRELARLADRLCDRRRLDCEIAALRAQRLESGRRPLADPARAAAADSLWMSWSERRLQHLGQDAVRAAAASEAARASARRAFGRAQALHQVAQKTGKPR